jgi:hypothetical protein
MEERFGILAFSLEPGHAFGVIDGSQRLCFND